MKQRVWLGIDLGTSGCRAIAINHSAEIIAQSRVYFPQHIFASTTSVKPDAQWQCVKSLITTICQQLGKYQIQAICVDATSGSVMLADENGSAVTDLLLYNDARAINESERIATVAAADTAAQGAGSGLAKCLFLQKQISQTKVKLLHQADWINYQLGATFAVTDYNNALKSGYDPLTLNWPAWIDELTSVEALPQVVAPGTKIGELNKNLCRQWGLTATADIIAGTTDSIAAFLATGAKQTGDAVTSLGSTLVLKMLSSQAIFAPEHGIYSHRLHDKWLIGGASNSGCAVLSKYFSDAEIDNLSQQIDLHTIAPDYYPLLRVGERFPRYDPDLAPRVSPRPTDDAVFLYGLLSGIANIEKQGYTLLENYSETRLSSIRTAGGGATNKVWQAIRQRLYTVPFIIATQTEAAYGSALLAKDGLK